VPPDAALARLLEGNQHFVAGTAAHPRQSAERRTTLAEGQHPFAIVLTCADSRVAPELYFDQGLGDLFVLRNAGNVLDDHIIGSIEYAVEHLHATLIIVVGHAQCGAVSAAVAGGRAPGHIHTLVESIQPAVELAQKQEGDKVDNTVRAHARRVAEILRRVEPILGTAVQAGHVKVVAGRYDLATGRVEILP
jgi:carbonic anhydrase